MESSRKRPTEKRASRSFDRVRGAPIASFEARPGSYCPLKPKHSPFIPLSFLSVSGNPKGREMQTFTGNDSKGKPWGFSKLVEPLEVVHRTWHVKAAVRRARAARIDLATSETDISSFHEHWLTGSVANRRTQPPAHRKVLRDNRNNHFVGISFARDGSGAREAVRPAHGTSQVCSRVSSGPSQTVGAENPRA